MARNRVQRRSNRVWLVKVVMVEELEAGRRVAVVQMGLPELH